MMGKHHYEDLELDWSGEPAGTVWFDRWNDSWMRKSGDARWRLERIATDEDVWLLKGRRYARTRG